MSQVVGTAIKPSITALFCTLPLSVRCSGYKADFVTFVSLLARRQILLHWKLSASPTHSLWINDVFHFIKLERIRYSLRGSSKNFYQIWGYLIGYMETYTPCILEDN